MFFINFEPKANNKDIYLIDRLMHLRVSFEPHYQKCEIAQYSNFQRYGHTRGFCHRNPRCVKCTGEHETVNCNRKERDTGVKFVLCKGNHPANYKGCAVYQELQLQKFPKLRPKEIQKPQFAQSNVRQPGISYAQIARSKAEEIQTQNNNQEAETVILQKSNDIL